MSAGELQPEIEAILREGIEADGPILWLTGAGISAESGVPTFRGEGGFWRVGSREYRPEELATWRCFSAMSDAVWGWYLYRRGICRAAQPNAAHLALASLEAVMGDRFRLVTQNVDGLHLRAGNTQERTYQIHGNIDFMRPAEGPGAPILIPAGVGTRWGKDSWIDSATRELLTMPDGRPTRPHILWFDESYDDHNYRVDSAAHLGTTCSLLVVVGTTGNTNLPLHIGRVAAQRGIPILVINPEENPFSQMMSSGGVFHLPGTAGQWVPAVAERLAELYREDG